MKSYFQKAERYRMIFAFIALLLFFASLGCECFCTINKCRLGIDAFVSGFFAMFSGGAALTWSANAFLLVAFILTFKGSKYSIIFSIISTIICFSFLSFDKIIEDEAGNYGKIIGYKIGFWLWASSAVVLVFCNFLFKKVVEVANDQF